MVLYAEETVNIMLMCRQTATLRGICSAKGQTEIAYHFFCACVIYMFTCMHLSLSEAYVSLQICKGI